MGRNKKKKAKVRAQFRKNRNERTRVTDWTRQFEQHGFEESAPVLNERISGKGELTRRRTIRTANAEAVDDTGADFHLAADPSLCRKGRVLRVHGLSCMVRDNETGRQYQCAVRRLLKTLNTDQRHVVVAGDHVLFRPVEQTDLDEGIIESIEPRRGSLCRASRGRQHTLVTNVDQVLIVTSAAEPRLKPNLVDRLLVSAEKSQIRPIICINKIDLVDPAGLQPLVGVYSQMGYEVLQLSAETGEGVDHLRCRMKGRESVVSGQSGVGKSSLLNRVDPSLALRVGRVSRESQKGRHTTSTAELLPLGFGGYVVDTPGIRQFQLWDVIAEEVVGFYRDLRPYVNDCLFPDCTHTHEADCAVKNAVADGRLDQRRYASYCHLREGNLD